MTNPTAITEFGYHQSPSGEFSASPDGRIYFNGVLVGTIEAKSVAVPHPDHEGYCVRMEFVARGVDVTEGGRIMDRPVFSSGIASGGAEMMSSADFQAAR